MGPLHFAALNIHSRSSKPAHVSAVSFDKDLFLSTEKVPESSPKVVFPTYAFGIENLSFLARDIFVGLPEQK